MCFAVVFEYVYWNIHLKKKSLFASTLCNKSSFWFDSDSHLSILKLKSVIRNDYRCYFKITTLYKSCGGYKKQQTPVQDPEFADLLL